MRMGKMMNPAAGLSDNIGPINFDQFYSVEFSIGNVKFLYQFKIWSSPSAPMFVLIKNGSDLLNAIKPGDILKMKYYSTDTACPTCHLDTQIVNIHWNDQGRFRGHYAVALDVLSNDLRSGFPAQ